MQRKKLIEVALPLRVIYVASAREESIHHGYLPRDKRQHDPGAGCAASRGRAQTAITRTITRQMVLKTSERYSVRWNSCGELRGGMDAAVSCGSNGVDHV